MAGVRRGVHELQICRSLVHCVLDLAADHHSAKRQIRTGDPFGEADDVRLDLPVVEGEPRPGSTEAGDDLVGNQQNVVSVRDLAQLRPVVVRRNDDTTSALHRLRNDGGDSLRIFVEQGLLELQRIVVPRRIGAWARAQLLELAAKAVGSDGLNEVGHQRSKHLVVGGQSGGAGGGHGHAVVAPAAGDDLDLVGFVEQLPEEPSRFECGFVGFGARGGEIHGVQVRVRELDQFLRQAG